MKQHITIEQLNELSDTAKEQLRVWWQPQAGDLCFNNDQYKKEYRIERMHDDETIYPHDADRLYPKQDITGSHSEESFNPLLSIGQMIEFLLDYDKNTKKEWKRKHGYIIPCQINIDFCDSLWEAVKKVLDSKAYIRD